MVESIKNAKHNSLTGIKQYFCIIKVIPKELKAENIHHNVQRDLRKIEKTGGKVADLKTL